MKILLVEDDDSLIALLTRSLNSQHYIVDAVKDGEMGWTYASTFDYDLIILDIMLPKLDGITLCKRLRGEGYPTPIMLLTAQDLITAGQTGWTHRLGLSIGEVSQYGFKRGNSHSVSYEHEWRLSSYRTLSAAIGESSRPYDGVQSRRKSISLRWSLAL